MWFWNSRKSVKCESNNYNNVRIDLPDLGSLLGVYICFSEVMPNGGLAVSEKKRKKKV